MFNGTQGMFVFPWWKSTNLWYDICECEDPKASTYAPEDLLGGRDNRAYATDHQIEIDHMLINIGEAHYSSPSGNYILASGISPQVAIPQASWGVSGTHFRSQEAR